jgi:hypothetical protein
MMASYVAIAIVRCKSSLYKSQQWWSSQSFLTDNAPLHPYSNIGTSLQPSSNMRYAFALAGLATMTMAAPLARTTYQAYYDPYAHYVPYSKAAEAAAEKMGKSFSPSSNLDHANNTPASTNMKRDPANNMAQDEHYTIYAGYRPYASYDPYSAAAEAEAAKMGMSE